MKASNWAQLSRINEPIYFDFDNNVSNVLYKNNFSFPMS